MIMFNLFKSEEAIIKEIHNDFDEAQDRLLAEAKMLINPLGKKAEKLMRLGFYKSETLLKHQASVKSVELADLILYYKQNYPFQKFITTNELDRLCRKYNLVYASVSRYLKDVPEKNLTEIESATPLSKTDSEDAYIIYSCTCSKGTSFEEKRKLRNGVRISLGEFRPNSNGHNCSVALGRTVRCEYETLNWKEERVDVSGLFIAAPKSHFDLTGLKNKSLGFFNTMVIEPKDPIVFRYVRGGVQILSKWGLEASDESLINEIQN